VLLVIYICSDNNTLTTTPSHKTKTYTELYKKSNLVFFEATWQGDYYNYLIPEIELPMITSKSPLSQLFSFIIQQY
jgi:hypothetical protein